MNVVAANTTPTPVGIFTTDAGLVIRSWDERLAAMTGIAAADALDLHLTTVVPELAARNLLARFENVVAHGVVEVLSQAFHRFLIRCPVQVPSSHFTEMRQHVTIAPVWADERVVGTLVTLEDVTPRLDQERARIAHIQSQDEDERLAATGALAGVEAAAPTFVALLGDTSWRVRHESVVNLGRIADDDSIAQVLHLLRTEHHNPAVLNSALQVLALNDIDVVPTLIDFLHGADDDLRIYAALALGYQPDVRSEVALIGVLDDPEPNVVYHAIEALGRLRARSAVAHLVAIAERRDFFLAFPALEALSLIGDGSNAERLVPLLDDALLSEAALDALGSLGDLSIVEPLAQALDQEQMPLPIVCRAIVHLAERARQRFGQAIYITAQVRRHASRAITLRLIEQSTVVVGDARLPLVEVITWLDGPEVDAALADLVPDPTVRGMVAEACVQRGAQMIDRLLPLLRASDPETRTTVINMLGQIGSPRATSALVALLEAEPDVAEAAAGALAYIGDQRAFKPLIALLGHPVRDVRLAATAGINSLGHPATSERVAELLSHPDPTVRDAAVGIAGYFGFPACVLGLLACASDPHERVREAAISQLGVLDDNVAEVRSLILTALQQDTPRVRAAAARAAGTMDDPDTRAALLAALHDSDAWVRYYAVLALAERVADVPYQVFAQVVHTDPAPQVRIAALAPLGACGGEAAVDLLIPFCDDPDADVARAALTGLGNTRSQRALPTLRTAVRTSDYLRAESGIAGLVSLGGDDAVAVLQWEAARARDAAISDAAIAALGVIQTPAAIAALMALLAEPERRPAASDALARVGASNIAQLALGMQHPDPATRAAVVAVLARVRHPDAVQALQVALADQSAVVRLAALHAIAYCAITIDRELLTQLAQTDDDAAVRRVARHVLRS